MVPVRLRRGRDDRIRRFRRIFEDRIVLIVRGEMTRQQGPYVRSDRFFSIRLRRGWESVCFSSGSLRRLQRHSMFLFFSLEPRIVHYTLGFAVRELLHEKAWSGRLKWG